MKKPIIICAITAIAGCMAAQETEKSATVRIRTVESKNGIQTVKDTSFTTYGDGSAAMLILGNDSLPRLRTIHLDASEYRLRNDPEAPRAPGESRNADDLLIDITDEGSDKSGHTVIIKKVKCGATNGEIDSVKKVVTVKVLRKASVHELSEADRKALYGNTAPHALDADNLRFYPNPSDGRFNLSFSLRQKGDVQVTITSLDGKRVFSEKLPAFSGLYDKTIDLRSQPRGEYVIRVTQGESAVAKKIILE